jgi:2-polyprenyl-3-methyl-5-hydroxy-6-metoxy-1,4-benzoquinol methylase
MGPAPAGIRRLAGFGVDLLDRAPRALSIVNDPSQHRVIQACASALKEVLPQAGDRLVHEDLHFDNILAPRLGDQREPWLAIDPNPVAGDPGFALLAALPNRWEEAIATGDVPRAIRRRFDLITEIVGLDRPRAAKWTLARILQNALWDVEHDDTMWHTEADRAIAHTCWTPDSYVRVDRVSARENCHTDYVADGHIRHRWEDWTWDETVFEGTATHYRQGRKPYSSTLAEALALHLFLDGRGRLLDVGCGPGTVAVLLAHLFESVIGLDPDPGMLREAQRAAAEEQMAHTSWIQMRAEDLPGTLGTFRVICFAQSFHWMDRPRVASAVRKMLDPNGAVIQIDLWHTNPPGQELSSGPYPPVPEAAIDELRRAWLGPDRRAGQGFRNTSPDGEDEVFQAAGFAPEELVIVPDDRVLERSAEDVVAWVLSTSSTAPHLFEDRLDDFIRDLRSLLFEVSPQGHFTVALSDNRLRIRRPR